MIPGRLAIALVATATIASALACGVGGSSSAPAPAAAATSAVAATSLAQPAATESVATVAPALEARRLTLEWPPKIRAGDSDVVRLTLEADLQGNLTPTAEIAGHETTGQTIQIPDLYATHNVVAAASLDMAGVEVRPADSVGQPLRPGEKVTFYWSVRPQEVGSYRGTVWLHLRFVPLDGGPETETAISSQVIQIEAVSLFGIGATPARWAGVLGTFLSTILGLPFLEELLRWLGARAGLAKRAI